jgi:aminoglycoside phosphotransferase (APT) family kinase protein
MTAQDPTPETAAEIVRLRFGRTPSAVRRFAAGLRHFVYEALFDDRAPVVVRLTRGADRVIARSAAALSAQLRPLGAPLPELIFDGAEETPFPYLVLERLPGRDLGDVAPSLVDAALDRIAARVVEAQALTATLPSAGRYGYAAHPQGAPFGRWSEVLDESLAKTRRRIAAAGLYDQRAPDRIGGLLDELRPDLDAVPATPFLHDTTTKNVIVTDDGGFSGIVDVDDLCYGDPRHAAALTLASLLGGSAAGGPTQYGGFWLARAGWRDDRVFRLYVALCLADFMSEEGQSFNGRVQDSGPEGRARLRAVFEAAAARV